MRKVKKDVQLRVGIFILLGIVATAGSILILGKNPALFSFTNKYKLQFQTVDGLFTGNIVTVNGIPAGNVMAIHFMQETGTAQVVVTVMQKFHSVITDRAEGSLITKGILGDKYIAITTPGSHKGEPLPPGSYIPTRPDHDILNLLADQATIQKISTIINEALVLLQKANETNTLKQISSFFSPDKAEELKQTMKHLKNIMRKIDKGEGTLGALINNKRIYNIILSYLGERPYHKYIPDLIKEAKKQKK